MPEVHQVGAVLACQCSHGRAGGGWRTGDGRKGSASGEGTKEMMDLVTSAGGHGPQNQPVCRHLEVGREIRNKLSRTHHS